MAGGMLNQGGANTDPEIAMGLAFVKLQDDPEGFKARVAEYTKAKTEAQAAEQAAVAAKAEAERSISAAKQEAITIEELRASLATQRTAFHDAMQRWRIQTDSAEKDMKERQDAVARAERKLAEAEEQSKTTMAARLDAVKEREDKALEREKEIEQLRVQAAADAVVAAGLKERVLAARAGVIAAVEGMDHG